MPADACHLFSRNNWLLKKLIGALRPCGSPVRAMKSSTTFCRATGSGYCDENNVSRYPDVLVVDGLKNSERVVVTRWLYAALHAVRRVRWLKSRRYASP